MTEPVPGPRVLAEARDALVRDERRHRRTQAVTTAGALAMSAVALIVSAWGAQWQAELIVTDARAQRLATAVVELDDANRRLGALGLPPIVLRPGAQADEAFLAALRGQAAADRAEERRALGQPIDPGPDPLVPPPALTGPSPLTPTPPATTTAPSPPDDDPVSPSAPGQPPGPDVAPAPTAEPAPSTATTPDTTAAPTPSDTPDPAPTTTEPSPAPDDPGLLPLLPGLRLPGIGPLLAT